MKPLNIERKTRLEITLFSDEVKCFARILKYEIKHDRRGCSSVDDSKMNCVEREKERDNAWCCRLAASQIGHTGPHTEAQWTHNTSDSSY